MGQRAATRCGFGLSPQRATGHSANGLGQLGNCHPPRHALRTLCNGVSRQLWVDDRRTFERGPFVLLLIATLFLPASNVASARTRPPVVGAYTAAGSAFLFVGNVLLFPDMPSHVVTSWWLGATLFYTLGLHIEKGDLFPGRRERLLLYVLIGLALIGAVLKNYALGAEFGDPHSVTPLLRWGGDRLLGFVMRSRHLALSARRKR